MIQKYKDINIRRYSVATEQYNSVNLALQNHFDK